MIKIWHISDTHGLHKQLKVPQDIDIAIFTGDASNYRDPFKNIPEYLSFLNWFGNLDIDCKVIIGGNHDSSLESRLIDEGHFEHFNINYLEDSGFEINGIKIWGSPWTPTFGRWSFMEDRNSIKKYWDMIPQDIDILLTHGPAYGFLDVVERFDSIESVGCRELSNVIDIIRPKYHLFGHIHNNYNVVNQGIFIDEERSIVFSNASCITDGNYKKVTSNGNVILIE